MKVQLWYFTPYGCLLIQSRMQRNLALRSIGINSYIFKSLSLFTEKFIFRRNLHTLREHAAISLSLLLYIISEQITIKVLESMSHIYGPDVLFSIWWGLHLADKIAYFILKNLYIIYSAHKDFPEFCGFVERNRSQKPRPITLEIVRGNVIMWRM